MIIITKSGVSIILSTPVYWHCRVTELLTSIAMPLKTLACVLPEVTKNTIANDLIRHFLF